MVTFIPRGDKMKTKKSLQWVFFFLLIIALTIFGIPGSVSANNYDLYAFGGGSYSDFYEINSSDATWNHLFNAPPDC